MLASSDRLRSAEVAAAFRSTTIRADRRGCQTRLSRLPELKPEPIQSVRRAVRSGVWEGGSGDGEGGVAEGGRGGNYAHSRCLPRRPPIGPAMPLATVNATDRARPRNPIVVTILTFLRGSMACQRGHPDALSTEQTVPGNSFETIGVVRHPIFARMAGMDGCDNNH
jgi:hypothetical protein